MLIERLWSRGGPLPRCTERPRFLRAPATLEFALPNDLHAMGDHRRDADRKTLVEGAPLPPCTERPRFLRAPATLEFALPNDLDAMGDHRRDADRKTLVEGGASAALPLCTERP